MSHLNNKFRPELSQLQSALLALQKIQDNPYQEKFQGGLSREEAIRKVEGKISESLEHIHKVDAKKQMLELKAHNTINELEKELKALHEKIIHLETFEQEIEQQFKRIDKAKDAIHLFHKHELSQGFIDNIFSSVKWIAQALDTDKKNIVVIEEELKRGEHVFEQLRKRLHKEE